MSSILAGIANEFLFHQSQAQVVWKSNANSNENSSPVYWEPVNESGVQNPPDVIWEIIPENREQNNQETKVLWKLVDTNNEITTPSLEIKSNLEKIKPSSFEEAEALLKTIPLQSTDFKPLLNLSHAVPTALTLSPEEWRLRSSTLSPFKYASGTGNQNYVIKIDYGLTSTLQISGFYSEADDPLNAEITGLNARPGNYWEVFGAASRWKFLAKKNWSLALISSLESWTVGSGGSDSLVQNSGETASPNIFNNSGKRVETQNIIGSIALPLTWNTSKKWQFTFSPGINFLPFSQGKGQGGEGEFYGTNLYISGGLLWQPIAEVGLTASVAHPLGSGTNSFDKNLRYSRVPVFSGGLNWHLNPRIALQGQLTNGFGATPATSLLTLPADNRLGYSAKIVLTPDAADTPQPPLSSRQQSLSLGGLTVDTALIPPDAVSLIKIGSDVQGNFNTTLGHSISNIFQFNFYRSKDNGVPQNTDQARTYMNNGAINWRGSGKAVLTSPLRGAPIWSALRISFGRNMDIVNNTGQGYLFAETPLTWEANSTIGFNINPKIAWSGVGTLYGLGTSSNIQLAPRWELIPEINIILNSENEFNGTLGLRHNPSENITIEVYGSTSASTIDIGQLVNAEEIRWGGRLIVKL